LVSSGRLPLVLREHQRLWVGTHEGVPGDGGPIEIVTTSVSVSVSAPTDAWP